MMKEQVEIVPSHLHLLPMEVVTGPLSPMNPPPETPPPSPVYPSLATPLSSPMHPAPPPPERKVQQPLEIPVDTGMASVDTRMASVCGRSCEDTCCGEMTFKQVKIWLLTLWAITNVVAAVVLFTKTRDRPVGEYDEAFYWLYQYVTGSILIWFVLPCLVHRFVAFCRYASWHFSSHRRPLQPRCSVLGPFGHWQPFVVCSFAALLCQLILSFQWSHDAYSSEPMYLHSLRTSNWTGDGCQRQAVRLPDPCYLPALHVFVALNGEDVHLIPWSPSTGLAHAPVTRPGEQGAYRETVLEFCIADSADLFSDLYQDYWWCEASCGTRPLPCHADVSTFADYRRFSIAVPVLAGIVSAVHILLCVWGRIAWSRGDIMF